MEHVKDIAEESVRRVIDALSDSSFTALRTDYSLQRLKHYTGGDPADIQHFILFPNYQRYIDEVVGIASEKLKTDDQ